MRKNSALSEETGNRNRSDAIGTLSSMEREKIEEEYAQLTGENRALQRDSCR